MQDSRDGLSNMISDSQTFPEGRLQNDAEAYQYLVSGNMKIQLHSNLKDNNSNYQMHVNELAKLELVKNRNQDSLDGEDPNKVYSSITQKHMNFEEMVKQSTNKGNMIKGKLMGNHLAHP